MNTSSKKDPGSGEEIGISDLFSTGGGTVSTSPNPRLFSLLHARFLSVVQQRIWNPTMDPAEIRRDAQDIVQETFLTIAEKYQHMQPKPSFFPWAFGILRNKTGDYFRKRVRERSMQEHLHGLDPPSSEQTTDEVIGRELHQLLVDTLTRLPVDYQTILLALLEGFLTRDILGMFKNIPRGTFDNKLHRLRARLKELLREGGYDYDLY
jgi:RNA polymerase sigma factor (sigma-70 family)